jgi:hypothetical protein
MNKFKKMAKGTGNLLVAMLTYIYLMVDRTILVPFPIIPSRSLQQYKDGPDQNLGFSILRVGAFVAIIIIFLAIKYFF